MTDPEGFDSGCACPDRNHGKHSIKSVEKYIENESGEWVTTNRKRFQSLPQRSRTHVLYCDVSVTNALESADSVRHDTTLLGHEGLPLTGAPGIPLLPIIVIFIRIR